MLKGRDFLSIHDLSADEVDEILTLAAELKECAEMNAVLDLRMETIRNRLAAYHEE